MNRRASRLPLLLALAFAAPVGLAQESEAPPVPTVPGTLVTGDQSSPLPLVRSPVGPLVALGSVVRALGGSVDGLAGSAGAFVLSVQDTQAVLGIGSQALTVGEQIRSISQPPRQGPDGPLVPIDLLERVYGDLQGYRFTWADDPPTLSATRSALRQIPMTVETVQLEDLTTVVLRFDEAPAYDVVTEPGVVRVELRGDAAQPTGPVRLPQGSLARRMELSPERIVLHLAAGVEVDHYVLTDPFRIVLDLYRGAPGDSLEQPIFQPPRPRPGIQTIVVDPGHGGGNPGARGSRGSLEKDLTLLLSRELKGALESRMPVNVELTRESDQDVELDARSALANANKADLFISVHLNSTRGGTAHGAETYFLSLNASDEAAAQAAATENAAGDGNPGPSGPGAEGDPLYDLQLILWDMAQSRHLEQSQQLAKLIQAELNRSLGLADRGVKQAPFRVLKGAAMPAVLVELGFINNPRDEERLRDPAYRGKLVQALVRAVQRFAALDEPARPEQRQEPIG
ncbi:MAG: N-acetylmuramoyl-L-alanine amidase [Thermoanaerobaculia bacterium]